MIIDTTQSKIERQIECQIITKPEDANIFKALIEAADRRYDDEGGCSCHINPPCTYCTSRGHCGICDDLVLSDHLVEFHHDWICEACHIRRGLRDEQRNA